LSVYTFTKKERILKRPEFLKLSKYGKKIVNRSFFALYLPGRGKRLRLGVTVTKKIGHAPARNRIKRLIREYFRLNKHRITGNCDINIIVKKGVAQLSSNEIFSSLQYIFDELHRRLNNY